MFPFSGEKDSGDGKVSGVKWSHSVVSDSLRPSMDCSLPGSSVHGILEARIREWGAISFSRDLPDPGIEPESPALQAVGPAQNEIKYAECPKTYIKNWPWCCHFFSFTAELLNMPNTHKLYAQSVAGRKWWVQVTAQVSHGCRGSGVRLNRQIWEELLWVWTPVQWLSVIRRV